MDTLSHGLWGGVVFGRKKFLTAFLFGIAPDAISFGPFFILWAINGFPKITRKLGEPPDPSVIPQYVYSLYNITHSLIVFLLVAAVVIMLLDIKPILAWGLHILLDIPTHTKSFFPTPYLWPFPTPYFDGFRWATPWFMVINYSILAVAVYFTFRSEAHS